MDHFLQSPNWKKMRCAASVCFDFDHGFAELKPMKLGLKQLYIGRAHISAMDISVLEKIAIDNKADLIRIDPASTETIPSSLGFKKVKDFQPSTTLILDLNRPEEELRTELHQKTRYNISLAEKKGIKIQIAGKEKFEEFWRLISMTYDRKGILVHKKEYYYKLINGNSDIYLTLALLDTQVIAANMMIRVGSTVTYLHGGADNKFRSFMAPHLLQWSEINRAKKDGYAIYDFWGIAPNDNAKHPWSGITRFKKGFGGQIISFPGTWEKGISWKYELYKLLTKLR